MPPTHDSPTHDSLLRVLPAKERSWPLFSAAASRAIEQTALQGLPPHTLMRRAGMAVARLALAIAPNARHIWVAAGPGNNGGDGLQAAMALHAAGKQVHVSLMPAGAHLPDDARDALAAAQQAGMPIEEHPHPPGPCDLAIDALFGLGGTRAPEGWAMEAVAALNQCAAPVLAVDMPTGLDAGHGRLLGDTAVQAEHTLCLLNLKPGLFTGAGRDHAGVVWIDDLGISPHEPPDAWLCGQAHAASRHRHRLHAQHKGSFGDVVVAGGASGMTGAAWLAGRSALVAGAGRVYVDLLAGDAGPCPWPELMCRPGLCASGDRALEQATVVAGCGGGQPIAALLPTLLERSNRLVLDADALNAIAGDASLAARLAGRRQPTLLTPHPLEAGRLLGCSAATVQQDRLAAAQELARRLNCAVLLKGSGSICAAPEAVACINPTGNALLASAGTGDVLAGWAAGLWAQQPGDSTSAEEPQAVGAAAAWVHGLAADRAEARGQRLPLVASALIDAMATELQAMDRR